MILDKVMNGSAEGVLREEWSHKHHLSLYFYEYANGQLYDNHYLDGKRSESNIRNYSSYGLSMSKWTLMFTATTNVCPLKSTP